MTVYVVDTGVYAQNREFDDADGYSRVALGIDAGCDDFPDPVCQTGGVQCSWADAEGMGHGTHVAAIIGGRTFGLAKNVTIVPVKALCQDYSISDITLGLDWIADTKSPSGPTAIVNISGINELSTSYYNPTSGTGSTLRLAIIGLASRDDLLVIQSAGNKSFTPSGGGGVVPACNYTFGDEVRYLCPGCPSTWAPAIARIVVAGGSDETDGLWRTTLGEPVHPIGSNVGSCVDIFSPASRIVSAYIPLSYGSTDPAEIVCQLSGTSMAAPHVSGVAAMILNDSPYLRVPALRQLLLNWGDRGLLETNESDPNFIGAGSPDLILHWDPSDIFRDGFESEDFRAWEVVE